VILLCIVCAFVRRSYFSSTSRSPCVIVENPTFHFRCKCTHVLWPAACRSFISPKDPSYPARGRWRPSRSSSSTCTMASPASRRLVYSTTESISLRNVVRLRLILPDRSTKRNESDAFIPPRRLPDVVDGRNEIELVSTQDLGDKRSPTEEKGAGKGGTP
jgi:hypothetical protein